LVWPSVPDQTDMGIMRRRLIAGCGIWGQQVNHLWLVPESRTTAVTPEDIALYMPWFMKAMEVTGCQYMVLLGSRSVWAWRPDLKPLLVNGHLYAWRDTWLVYPLPHPGFITKREMPDWDMLVARLGNMVREDNFSHYLGAGCMKCQSGVYMYDRDGVPYCRTHIEDGFKAQRKGKEKWGTLTINATNTQLFPTGES
jgi:hypothetical protein